MVRHRVRTPFQSSDAIRSFHGYAKIRRKRSRRGRVAESRVQFHLNLDRTFTPRDARGRWNEKDRRMNKDKTLKFIVMPLAVLTVALTWGTNQCLAQNNGNE